VNSMNQNEKIQAVFESVELEKHELNAERAALKEERLRLEEERTQLNEDRKCMRQAAQKMGELNLEGAADVSEAARKIKNIKSNTDQVLKVSLDAIKSVKQQKRFSGVIMNLMTLMIAAVIGLAVSHYAYTNYLETEVLALKIASIEAREKELISTQKIVIELKDRGLKVFRNAIVLPQNWEDLMGKTQEGESALFTE